MASCLGPYTVSDCQTVVTTDGSALIARQNIGDIAWVPFEFAVGDCGFDPLNVTQVIPPDGTVQALENELYRGPIERFERPTDSTMAIVCRIPSNSGLRIAIGEIGVFVILTVVNNNAPLPGRVSELHVGDVYLFSLTHRPIRCLTPDETDLFQVAITL